MHDVKALLERTLKRPLPRIREQGHSIYARNDQPIARLRNIHQLTQRNGVCLLQADDLAVGEPTPVVDDGHGVAGGFFKFAAVDFELDGV